MKKAEIIKSKHVDHIENEKNILEKIQHPFVVSINFSNQMVSISISVKEDDILTASWNFV